MTNQHFGMKLEYLIFLFDTMNLIKMFLRKSYGVLERFYTRSQERPFQGDSKDNEDDPLI